MHNFKHFLKLFLKKTATCSQILYNGGIEFHFLISGISWNDETKSEWSRPRIRLEGSIQDFWSRQGWVHRPEGAQDGGHDVGLHVDEGRGRRVYEGSRCGEFKLNPNVVSLTLFDWGSETYDKLRRGMIIYPCLPKGYKCTVRQGEGCSVQTMDSQ